jgi:hypothetical protein
MAPYDEPPAERRKRIERVGVPLWQEDLWKEIIRAAESDKPDETRFMEMSAFDAPAANQYAATTPELLRWFDGYNERQPSGRELCRKIGDGVNQAADLISATASIPSLNFIPLTTFGNWF